MSAFAVASARTMDSLGPAGRPVSILSARWRLAATSQGLPGPTIFADLGIKVAVPKAAAATATAPPTRKTRVTPASLAAKSEAASMPPSGVGGVRTVISGTPATTAGMVVIIMTEGKAPLPRGT